MHGFVRPPKGGRTLRRRGLRRRTHRRGTLVVLLLAAHLPLLALAKPAAAQDHRFDKIRNVTEINSTFQEKSPCISSDNLEIFFQSNRPGGDNTTIWTASRAATDEPFGEPRIALQDAATPDLAFDHLTLYFSRLTDGVDADLWMATRDSRELPFGTASRLATVSSTAKEAGPSISADGLELYFHSDRPDGAGQTDLWVATRSSVSDPFGEPRNLTEINTAAQEWSPQVGRHGLSLFFSSNREGSFETDLWVATRSHTQEPFGDVRRVKGTVNTPSTDKAADIAGDGLHLYLRSSREGGEGASDIWVAIDSRSGNVNRRLGPTEDVLFLNGSTGGPDRTVELAREESITLTLETSPAGPSPADYVLYAERYIDPSDPVVAPQPFDVGPAAFPTPFDGTGMPFVIGNTFDGPGAKRLGIPRFDLDPAPGDVFVFRRGVDRRVSVVIQALLLDDGSTARIPLSLSNAVFLRID